MKQHEFQFAARQFRAGKLSLKEFTDKFLGRSDDQQSDQHSENPDAILKKLTSRKTDSHKGDFGRVLIVAGSPGMAGAAALTGMAALHSGAGLVTVATDSRCRDTVASFHPAIMTVDLPIESSPDDDEDWSLFDSHVVLESHDKFHDVMAIGPGVGTSRLARSLMRSLVKNARIPTVVDADAINALAATETETAFDLDKHQGAPIVMTPHPGELSRLMPDPSRDRGIQERFAIHLASHKRIIVLKGHRTLITDGKQSVYNETGNPGMATAGCGDVLTGIIASFIGQGLPLWEAAVAGVHVHGMAGDAAARRKSQLSMVATDIIGGLDSALRVEQD